MKQNLYEGVAAPVPHEIYVKNNRYTNVFPQLWSCQIS
jgi:hypothetical protein